MKTLSLSILLLLSSLLFGQNELQLISGTGEKYNIGVNGFLQAESVSKAHLKGLTGDSIQLQILEDSTNTLLLDRKIIFNEARIHDYKIQVNFQGRLQIRYRGALASSPHKAYFYNTHTPLPLPLSRDSIPEIIADTALIAILDTTQKTEDTLLDITAGGFPIVDFLNDTLVKLDSTTRQVDSLTIPIITTQDTLAIIDSAIAAYPKFYGEIKNIEFEFERLNYAMKYLDAHEISTQELGQVLELLKYDNSKLQLIIHAKDKVSDKNNMLSLEKHLEYNLSKDRLKTLIK